MCRIADPVGAFGLKSTFSPQALQKSFASDLNQFLWVEGFHMGPLPLPPVAGSPYLPGSTHGLSMKKLYPKSGAHRATPHHQSTASLLGAFWLQLL